MESKALLQMFQALVSETQANIGPSAQPATAERHHERSDSVPQTRLDEEFQALQAIAAYTRERMLENRSQCNQLSPVHQLPDEILSAIFSLAVRDERGAQLFYDITLISNVCRLWRGIISEGSPNLWTGLYTLPTRLVNVFLTRSRAAPLEIEFDQTENPKATCFSEFLHLVLPQFHCWKTCRFVLFDKDDITSFLRHTATSASQLETLDLQLKSNAGRANRLFVFHHPFAGITPELRNLTLERIPVPLEAPMFKGLTRLTLRDISYSNIDSIYQLLRVLEASPFLEGIDFMNLGFLPIPHFTPEAHGI
ncbi:hypothetical protein BOTBODRAFT_183278 [Botryobasidium botryosum FD-172 SS1]|uniref:F-box domain-containing protein n=1 Tax=Botryobasidium botryosum (strain FD-172 SS1) TaxID=930990 RepID=A0A067N0L8_BOTB1|nr:hypothetical protein BOTBODRAFT_183278 [Botryobasidium botryosum FD-172 SS1]